MKAQEGGACGISTGRKRGMTVGLALLAMSLGGVGSATAAEPSFRIVPPKDKLYGVSYGQLAGTFTNWVFKEPGATNPLNDPDGRFCDKNQSGLFWFLAGGFGEIIDRTCTIPAGKAIFFSTGSTVSFPPDFPEPGNVCLGYGSTIDAVRCDANDDVQLAPNVVMSVEIDGTVIPDILAYRAQSGPGGFVFKVPAGSLPTEFGFAPGNRYPSVADGYWILLRPLSPGVHTVKFSRTFADGSEEGAAYTLNVQGQ